MEQNLFTPDQLLALLKQLAPVLAPVVVALLKWALVNVGSNLPIWFRPFFTALVGALIAALTGGGAAGGAVLGVAGMKVRDYVVKGANHDVKRQ